LVSIPAAGIITPSIPYRDHDVKCCDIWRGCNSLRFVDFHTPSLKRGITGYEKKLRRGIRITLISKLKESGDGPTGIEQCNLVDELKFPTESLRAMTMATVSHS
jgi:hypothetical protein